MALSSLTPTWVDSIREENCRNSELQQLREQFKKGELKPTLYTSREGLFLKGRIYIASESPLRYTILKQLHESPIGGHSGFHKTLHRVKANFFWKGLHLFVHSYIRECDTCKRMKGENISPAELLQPLPFRREIGLKLQWVLSRFYPSLKGTKWFLWLWISYPNTTISFLSHTFTRHLQWLACLWTMSLSCMGCLSQM